MAIRVCSQYLRQPLTLRRLGSVPTMTRLSGIWWLKCDSYRVYLLNCEVEVYTFIRVEKNVITSDRFEICSRLVDKPSSSHFSPGSVLADASVEELLYVISIINRSFFFVRSVLSCPFARIHFENVQFAICSFHRKPVCDESLFLFVLLLL